MIFDKNTKITQQANGAGKTGYPHEKEGSWVLIFYHIQKLTQNV